MTMMTSLPPWVSPDEDKPAPMPLLLVQAFVNTWEGDRDTDLLLHADSGTLWMRDAGLIGPYTTLTPADLRSAREVRESLRALLTHNSGGPAPTSDELRALDALTRSRTASLSVDGTGHVHLGPQPGGRLDDGLLGLLLVVRDAQELGTWPRLKTCGNPDCRWAFFDRSHSRRGTWCDMASCGNLIKNRNLRARRR
jgi:predicted RNA-binding Zn ribbon-like protein